MKFEIVFSGEFGRPKYHLFADGIYSMESHLENGFSFPLLGLLIFDLTLFFLSLSFFLIVMVKHHITIDRPYAHFNCSLPGLVCEPVLVIESGCAGLNHFQAGN